LTCGRRVVYSGAGEKYLPRKAKGGAEYKLWQTHMSAQHLQDYLAATEGAVDEFTLNEMTRID